MPSQFAIFLTDEIDDDQMKEDVREHEVCKRPLGTDAFELALVLRIDLREIEHRII